MHKENKIIFYKDFQYCFFTRNGGVSKKKFIEPQSIADKLVPQSDDMSQ